MRAPAVAAEQIAATIDGSQYEVCLIENAPASLLPKKKKQQNNRRQQRRSKSMGITAKTECGIGSKNKNQQQNRTRENVRQAYVLVSLLDMTELLSCIGPDRLVLATTRNKIKNHKNAL